MTASEDKTARLWDFRSDQQLATFKPPNSKPGFTSCGLSLSGRFIFCGSDDNSIHIWDTLKNQHNGETINFCKRTTSVDFQMISVTINFILLSKGVLSGHENRVTSLSVSDNGMAVASCSWDQHVRIWV